MIFTFFIAFFSLIGLLALHELGHFVLAKKFGVKVDEFGLGYPPRLFGKKFGQTLYSVNLLPFGAFVKIYGEEKTAVGGGSFRDKPLWKRALIIFGGAASFWVMAAILLSVVMGLGVPTVIEDTATGSFANPRVQIADVSPASPAEAAGLKVGDAIIKTGGRDISKVSEVQEFTSGNKGQDIVLTIERGKDVFDVSLIVRANPPSGQGPLGVALVRTALQPYPWYQLPVRGVLATGNLTGLVVKGWAGALTKVFKGTPSGVQLVGPVGIFSMLGQASQMGVSYFLQFIAIIAVHLALFNMAPIPAVDGGKLLFLAIEKFKGRPINEKTEIVITNAFFAALIVLMIFVTIKDIARLF